MRLRGLNKLYANLLGYFWLPCPLCKQFFGGHEWKSLSKYHLIPTKQEGLRQGICPDCGNKRQQEQ